MRELYTISPLGTVGILATGMTQGALFSMGAVFARGYGLSVAEVSFYMFALITAGPPLTGWLMDLSGPKGFLWYFVVLHLVMVAYAFYRMSRSEAPSAEDRFPYAPVPGRTGELAETWVEEVMESARSPADDAKP